MRAVLQRVLEAEVTVAGESVGRIGPGLVILAGIAVRDDVDAVAWMARKILSLRVFDGDRELAETGGGILAVSQFTLLADCRKGRRPSYDAAMRGEDARPLFDRFVAELRAGVADVATGRFGATMAVRIVNDGPLTLLLESPSKS